MKTDISDLRKGIIEEARSRMPRPPDKDEITSEILSKELSCTIKKAYCTLERMVEDGKATKRKNGIGGRNVYKEIT